MMSMLPDINWMLLETTLEWGKLLAATYLGWRAVRAYERRGGRTHGVGDDGRRQRRVRHALQRRVRRLETAVRRAEAQSAQALEAQRFTTAVLTRPAAERGASALRQPASG